MSCLKLYAPDEVQEEHGVVEYLSDEEPAILSWSRVVNPSRNPSLMEVLARTRTLYRNRSCRSCGRPTVEPVQLNDATLGKGRLPIPGTATLVGFHCQYCRHEWSA